MHGALAKTTDCRSFATLIKYTSGFQHGLEVLEQVIELEKISYCRSLLYLIRCSSCPQKGLETNKQIANWKK
ncbi:hypothetical protein P9597_22825 [Aneurinibacillus migulanus]|uniref:hypothetical protein n=1 Tax=Aneurinibacillus migulanus TaxID=47500 RepID=UPI002E1B8781|nr:hypothetical protein [Aneurinibacillus migulanus]